MNLQRINRQIRPTFVDVTCKEPLYYQFVVGVTRCGGSCNTADDP